MYYWRLVHGVGSSSTSAWPVLNYSKIFYRNIISLVGKYYFLRFEVGSTGVEYPYRIVAKVAQLTTGTWLHIMFWHSPSCGSFGTAYLLLYTLHDTLDIHVHVRYRRRQFKAGKWWHTCVSILWHSPNLATSGTWHMLHFLSLTQMDDLFNYNSCSKSQASIRDKITWEVSSELKL